MNWAKGVKKDALMDKYCSTRTVKGDGSASYSNFSTPDRWQAILNTAIEDEDVSEAIKALAISKASSVLVPT